MRRLIEGHQSAPLAAGQLLPTSSSRHRIRHDGQSTMRNLFIEFNTPSMHAKCGSHLRVALKHRLEAVESGSRDATQFLEALENHWAIDELE